MPSGRAISRTEAPAPGGAVLPEGPAAPSVVRDLYELAKPRLTALVVVTTAVGYYLAFPSAKSFLLRPWLMTLLGTALVSAAASVLNQWIERDRDLRMPRTRTRPFATGRLEGWVAALYAIVAGLGGLSILCVEANPTAAGIALATLVLYVVVYTPIKTRHSLNTIVGAIPGALPPLIGWAAAAGTLPFAAWTLFLIVFFWQVPHFLAIATMYRDDYRSGGYAMLPVTDVDGAKTGRMAALYAIILAPVALLPALVGLAGPTYAILSLPLGIGFAAVAMRFERQRSRARARQLFLVSLVHLPALLILLCLDSRELVTSPVVLYTVGGP